MSPVCTGGSTTKPGVPSSVVVTPQYLEGVTGVPAWLQPFLPYFDSLYIGSVSDFCASDRPAILSVPSASDFLSFLSRSPLEDYLSVKSFINSVMQAYLWNQLCQCVSGTVTGPTAPADPGNLPQINPPGVIFPPPGGPCATYAGVAHFNAPNEGARIDVIGKDGGPYVAIPAGATSARMSMINPDDGTAPSADHGANMALYWQDAAGVETFGFFKDYVRPAGYASVTASVPADKVSFRVYSSSNSVDLVNYNDIPITVEFFCGAGGGGLAPVPCCPPDPSLTAMLASIATAVELIQRQVAPFATVDGAAHSGLTGEGRIDVQGLLGVRVDLTTVPGYQGVQAGDVDAIYNAGWINWGDPLSFRPREWIQTSPTLSTPPLAGMYTRLSYSLNPGFVATITEVKREP